MEPRHQAPISDWQWFRKEISRWIVLALMYVLCTLGWIIIFLMWGTGLVDWLGRVGF